VKQEPMAEASNSASVWGRVLATLKAHAVDKCVKVYDYATDFDSLWFHNQPSTADPATAATLICWNGFPQAFKSEGDHRDYASHLTPYHWALVDTCRRPAHGARRSVWVLHGPSILTGSGRNKDRVARAIRCLALGEPELDWLRGFSLPPLIMVDGHPRLCEFETLVISIAKQSAECGAGTASGGTEFKLPADLKATISAMLFSSPDSGHAVANAVGPLVLAECLSNTSMSASGGDDRETPRAYRALRQLLVALRMAPEKPSVERGIALSPRTPGALSPTPPAHRLVDDEVAFVTVLKDALAPSELARVEAAELIRALAAAEPNGMLDGLGDVLWLDLRLWPTGDKQKRRDLLERILAILEAEPRWIPATDGETVDRWIVRAREAREAAKDLVEMGPSHSEADDYAKELKAVTLLPLLLSRADPSLPIVIFSSTRQREVDKRLRVCPNIVLDFTKPTVGHVMATADTVRDDFVHALKSAEQLAALRPLWRRIVGLKELRKGDLPAPRVRHGLRMQYPGGMYRYLDAKWQLDGPQTKKRLERLFAIATRADLRAMMPATYEVLEAGYSEAETKQALASIDVLWGAGEPLPPEQPRSIAVRRELAQALYEIRRHWVRGLAKHEDPAYEEALAPWACAALLWALLEVLLAPSEFMSGWSAPAEDPGASSQTAPDSAFIGKRLFDAIRTGQKNDD